MLCLGIDTSNYTTSAALCRPQEEPRQLRKLLPVPAGERGLRQSEAVFAHVRQLNDVLLPLLQTAGEPITCVCASVSPRDGDASYMPVFQVGLQQGKALAAALGVPFLSALGPRIRVGIVPVSTVSAAFSTEFESAGINQTRHKIYLTLHTAVRLVIPSSAREVSLSSQVLIAESIIVGSVPDSFVQVPEMDGALNFAAP